MSRMEREAATERQVLNLTFGKVFGSGLESAMGGRSGAFAGVTGRTVEKVAKNIAATMPVVREAISLRQCRHGAS